MTGEAISEVQIFFSAGQQARDSQTLNNHDKWDFLVQKFILLFNKTNEDASSPSDIQC